MTIRQHSCVYSMYCVSSFMDCMVYDSNCACLNDRCQLCKCCAEARPTQSHLLVSTPEVMEGRTPPPSL